MFAVSTALLFALATSPAAHAARPKNKAESRKLACAQSYEAAQLQRKEGRLIAARESLLSCAQDACPKVVKKDCLDWLTNVETSIPTVVFEARRADRSPLTEVRVELDGKRFVEALDGKSRPLDPGPHRVRFESEEYPPVELELIALEGEKNKKISVDFADSRGTKTPTITVVAAPPAKRAARELTATGAAPPPAAAGVPLSAYIAAGTTLAALGSFAYFGITARERHQELEELCAPECSASDVSGAETRAVVADVSLIVAVLSLGLAAVSLITAGDDRWEDAP